MDFSISGSIPLYFIYIVLCLICSISIICMIFSVLSFSSYKKHIAIILKENSYTFNYINISTSLIKIIEIRNQILNLIENSNDCNSEELYYFLNNIDSISELSKILNSIRGQI